MIKKIRKGNIPPNQPKNNKIIKYSPVYTNHLTLGQHLFVI